jgi:Ca2+-binding RTX toxin-like protein
LTIAVDNAGFTTNIANKLGQNTANLTLEGSGVGTGGLTLTGLTTLNLASTKGNSTATVANSINNFVANPDNLKILVTGDQALTVAAPNATLTGVTVDATKFTAKLNFTGTGKVDSLTGGTGADTLTGGLGADALTGGVGADTFSYNPGGAVDSNAGTLTGVVTFDTISDFDVAADKLSSALFVPANLTAQGTVQAAVNVSGATTLSTAIGVAAAAIGASKYGAFQIAGSTYVLANDAVVGTVGAGDLLVQLTGNLTLTATNYTV